MHLQHILTSMHPTPQELLIRPGTVTDSTAIGRILADGWRQAYSGFMPEGELGPRVDPDHRAREVGAWLATDFDTRTELLLVAELAGDLTGDVAGFLAARLGDRNDVGSVAQITLLYVSPERQGRGIGRQLLLKAADWLKVHAPGAVSIGAFEQNPFRSLYDTIGGVVVKQIMVRVDAFEWPVVIYLWPSPEALQEGIRTRRA